MSIKGLVKGIQDKTLLLAFFAILAIILPGLTAIYIYHPQEIVQLDWVKLILLSIAFTGPFVTLNSFIIGATDTGKRNASSFFLDLVEGSLMTGLMFYMCLAALLIFKSIDYHPFGFAYANEIVLGFLAEIVLAIVVIRENKKH